MSQSGYGPPPPYAPSPPPRQSSSTIILVVLLILMVVIGLPILLVVIMFAGCCGMLGLGAAATMQIPAQMIKQQYGDDPVVVQHLGELQSATWNLQASIEEEQKRQQDGTNTGENVMVFDVRGAKGSGQIIAEGQNDAPGQTFSKATLRTAQGEFPLSP